LDRHRSSHRLCHRVWRRDVRLIARESIVIAELRGGVRGDRPSSVEPATPSAGLAPMAVRDAVLDNDAGGSAAAAQPPQRRLRFIVPRAVLQASRAGRRPGEWSPARLSNGHSNGVAPGTLLPGGSSDEEEDGQNTRRR
jgi:hypothetical protein